MKQQAIRPSAFPGWLPELVRVMQDSRRNLRVIDVQLRHAMQLAGLDPRLATELRYLRDSLGAVDAGLLQLDDSTRRVAIEMTDPGRTASPLAIAS
jgi:hypothetical protein